MSEDSKPRARGGAFPQANKTTDYQIIWEEVKWITKV